MTHIRMLVGIIWTEEIDNIEKRKDIAVTIPEKSQVGEILTTSGRVGFKEGHKSFFHY